MPLGIDVGMSASASSGAANAGDFSVTGGGGSNTLLWVLGAVAVVFLLIFFLRRKP